MTLLRFGYVPAITGLIGTALVAACSSRPSQLYLLSAETPATRSQAASAAVGMGTTAGPSRAAGTALDQNGPVIGVQVTIPEYLDRLDVVERTGANEIKPIYSAQWGESLSVTAGRVLAENLSAHLPAADVVMLPSRIRRQYDYEVTLDLTSFESDAQGISRIAGRWSIANDSGDERASGRIARAEQVYQPGYDAMAAAMSRNLEAVSADIAAAVRRLSTSPVSGTSVPRAAHSSERRKR